MKGRVIFAIALFVFLIILLIATLRYPLRAAIFPLIMLSIAIILSASLILPREVLALTRKKEATEAGEVENLGRKYLVVGIWIVVALAMFGLLGLVATVILFPFLYLRCYSEKWSLSIYVSLGSGIFFYVVFYKLLGLPLYPGFLFSHLFG